MYLRGLKYIFNVFFQLSPEFAYSKGKIPQYLKHTLATQSIIIAATVKNMMYVQLTAAEAPSAFLYFWGRLSD